MSACRKIANGGGTVPIAIGSVFDKGYRYKFNGKETDNETGLQNYGFRIYNPSLGKFVSTDPLGYQYPMLSTYQFASNTPVWAIDLDGLEGVDAYYNIVLWANGKTRFGKEENSRTEYQITTFTIGTMTTIIHQSQYNSKTTILIFDTEKVLSTFG